MPNKDKLHSTLEALKELKAEYYIGSQDAFSYLKSMRWLESERQKIVDRLASHDDSQRLISKLTERRTDWLLYATTVLIMLELNKVAAHDSSPQDWSAGTYHYVTIPIKDVFVGVATGHSDEWREYFWTVSDYTPSAVSFICSLGREPIEPTSLKCQTASEAEIIYARLAQSIEDSLRSGLIQLVSTATNETISFHQFRQEARLRYCPPSARCEMDHTEIQDHSIADIDETRQTFSSILPDLLLDGDASTENWLYEAGLYKRAEREYTLGYTEIERRIALNELRQFGHIALPANVRIHGLLNRLKKRLSKYRQSLHELEAYSASQGAVLVIKIQRHLVQKSEYKYLAVLQNKKWLIEFLSH